MTRILEFQRAVADRLNGVETLVQGGCRALAEDALDAVFQVREQLETAGGVALVVTTPRLDRNGCAAPGAGIPCGARLDVRCVERPALNREAPSHLTALDAAALVARELDGPDFLFRGIDQRGDERTGAVSATASFDAAIYL